MGTLANDLGKVVLAEAGGAQGRESPEGDAAVSHRSPGEPGATLCQMGHCPFCWIWCSSAHDPWMMALPMAPPAPRHLVEHPPGAN